MVAQDNFFVSYTDLGWLAGIIDGEGCLTIKISIYETKYFGRRPKYQPQLTITNCDSEIINRASQTLTILKVKHRQYIRNRGANKPQHCIDVGANGLRILLPSLDGILAKKEQAKILMEALNLTSEHMKRKTLYLNDSKLQEMDTLRKRLQELHGRQAKKLSKIISADYAVTPEQLTGYEDFKKNRNQILQEGRDKYHLSRKKARATDL